MNEVAEEPGQTTCECAIMRCSDFQILNESSLTVESFLTVDSCTSHVRMSHVPFLNEPYHVRCSDLEICESICHESNTNLKENSDDVTFLHDEPCPTY